MYCVPCCYGLTINMVKFCCESCVKAKENNFPFEKALSDSAIVTKRLSKLPWNQSPFNSWKVYAFLILDLLSCAVLWYSSWVSFASCWHSDSFFFLEIHVCWHLPQSWYICFPVDYADFRRSFWISRAHFCEPFRQTLNPTDMFFEFFDN